MLDKRTNNRKGEEIGTPLKAERKWALLFVCLVAFFYSCKNDIEKIKAITKNELLPAVSMEEAEIVYTDSALMKLKITGPIIKQFDLPDNPYMEFPEGIKVEFFNDTQAVSSTITAGYAIYYTKKELWEARHNVQALNLKGEQLNTEQMFWDRQTGRIYSNKYSRIQTADGIFYGKNGFESDEEFNTWKLKGSEGTVNIQDETN